MKKKTSSPTSMENVSHILSQFKRMMSNFQRIIADQAEEAWEHPCIERAKSKECLRIKTEDLQLFRMLGEDQLLWSLEIGGQSTFKMTTA